MRTYTAWEPLQDPGFESDLDRLRVNGPAWAYLFYNSEDPGFALLQAEVEAMRVAAKVAEADEWLCRICGGTSRTCECES